MEHVVFFPAPDGAPVFRRVASIEDAVHLVEHLRNVEGVQEVSVHPLGTEVPLAFRAYYRVEVPAAPEPVRPDAVDVVDTPVLVAVPQQPDAEPVPAEGNGHAPEGVRSLGFFA